MPLIPVFLGLGSNTDREAHLCAGLDALDGLLRSLRCSPVFESRALGADDGFFLNMVVGGQTDLPLAVLKQRLKAIEADNGRQPDVADVPLDIDILLYGRCVGVFEGMTLPRVDMLQQAFVLWPLALLAPDGIDPRSGRRFDELWAQARLEQELHPLAFRWRDQELTPAELWAAYPAR